MMRPAKRKSDRLDDEGDINERVGISEDSEIDKQKANKRMKTDTDGAPPPPPPPPRRSRSSTDDRIVVRDGIDSATATKITDKEQKRTSNLRAPIMLLEGHSGAVHTIKFDPTGNFLASGSFDRTVQFWGVYGDCDNYMMLKGHKNAILDLHWSTDGSQIFTASADKTVVAWDAEVGKRVRKWTGHDSFVNACCPTRKSAGTTMVVSGSDDGTTRVWDLRAKTCVKEFENKFQITSVAFSDDGESVFAGGLDETIKAWDMRNDEVSFTLEGHRDTITGISLSPDGNHLLSNGMDNCMYMWDVRAFVTAPSRCLKRFEGASHDFEKMLLRCSWSADGRRVSAGSADQHVYVWEVDSQDIAYCLPGHRGSVNEVTFHPKEPIIGSCGSDKNIFLGELSK